MNPTPEKMTEWREEFEKTEWPTELKRDKSGYLNNYIEGVWQGYLRARTEQAIEIAQTIADIERALYALTESETENDKLKAKLVEAESKIEYTKIAFENIIIEEEKSMATLLPLAKFGAMVAAAHSAGDLIDAEDLTDGMLAAELLTDDNGVTNYVKGIEEKIMEVLR